MSLTLEHVFAAAFRHRSVAGSLQEALRSDLVVANPFQRQLGEFLYGFLENQRDVPKQGDVLLWIATLPPMQADGVREAWERIDRTDIAGYTPDHLADHAVAELRLGAAKNALSRLNASTNVTPEILQEFSDRVRAIQPVTLEGLGDIRDVERWVRTPEVESRWPSGISKLDAMLGGGFGPELTMVMADSGVGKTTLLCNFGSAAALHGATVLQVSMELDTRKTMQRYYRKIAEANRQEITDHPDDVAKRVRHWLRFAKGGVWVLFQEAYTLDPETLRTLCRRFVDQKGRLDYLILDYIDLMHAPKGMDRLQKHDQLGRITHMVRNMKDEFGCSICTATQAQRGTHPRMKLEHMGDSYDKVRGSDNIFGLSQNEEEEELHQGRLAALKLRDSPGKGREIPLFIDMDLMLIADLDHTNTIRIMREKGYLPEQRGAQKEMAV